MSLTGKQLFGCSRFGGLSWLLLAVVDFSSVLLPGSEEEKVHGPDGLLRLLFIPTDSDNPHKTGRLKGILTIQSLN